MTPLHPAFAEQFNRVPVPGLQKGEAGVTQDILKKSFPLFNIKEGRTVKDYDLVYITHGMLFRGAKSVDGTPFDKPENRPANLRPRVAAHGNPFP